MGAVESHFRDIIHKRKNNGDGINGINGDGDGNKSGRDGDAKQ